MSNKFNVIITAIGGTVGYFLGGFDILLQVFSTVVVIDIITGMYKGYSTGKYESTIFRKCILKKSGYILALLLVVQLDKLMGDIGMLRSAILFCFIANEATSIVENLGEAGVPMPKVLKNAIKALRNKGENLTSEK